MNDAIRGRRSVAANAVRETRARGVKKVVTDFPLPLYQETERAARELSMNRSRFIRSAVETFLRNREREKLERAIAESLVANAELDRQLVDEFKYPDSDEGLAV
jgi:metal-responsive CopG/Arc/MetJ family transcriptional regulator